MLKICLMTITLFFGSAASADNPFAQRNHKLGIGLDYWSYHEPGVMKDRGPLYSAEYEYRNVYYNYLFTQFSVDAAIGITRYNGADLATNEPLAFDQLNTLGRIQAYLGVALPFKNGWAIIPKVGLLYRTLTDHDDEFRGDYQRDQEYFVVPIGFEIVYNAYDGRQLTFGGWFSTSFSGTNKTYLTDVGGDRDLTLKQTKGSGFEVYGTYSFDTYYISGVVGHWKVGDSEFKDASVPALGGIRSFYEPENETVSVGARVGFHF